MSVADVILLVAAGVGAGLTGSTAGLASLFSYPALLAVGLAPITANVTNSVALIFSSIGSVAGSRPELAGQSRRVRPLAWAALAGGTVGAILLLATPSESFEKIVPFLLAGGVDRHPHPPPLGWPTPSWPASTIATAGPSSWASA